MTPTLIRVDVFFLFMMTSSNGKIFRVTGLWCGEFTGEVNSSHKGHWRGAHYDVTVIFSVFSPQRLTKYTYAMIMTRRVVVFFLTVQSLIHSLFSLTVAIYTSLIVDRVTQRQGAVSIRKTVLPGMAIPMLKIRRPNGRLIFNMEIAIRR